MARPISDEELQLKKRARRRLVGAIVLVSAVAVILPMVLDSEPKSVSRNVDIQIPASDQPDFKPKTVAPPPAGPDSNAANTPAAVTPPAEAPAATADADTPVSPKSVAPSPRPESTASAAPAPSGDSPPASGDQAAASEPSKSVAAEAKPHVSSSSTPAKVPVKAAATAAAKDASGSAHAAYVVQVAALADPSRAKQLQKQIAGSGIKAYTQVVATKSGEITRVRAGPYSTRESAEKARAQLKRAGLDGKVVPK